MTEATLVLIEMPAMGESVTEGPSPSGYQLPVLSFVYGPARWFIDGGMTRGIPDASARACTITVSLTSGRSLTASVLPAPTRSQC